MTGKNTETDAHSGQQTTGHEWDGLRELNTPLPTWWLYTFYACILGGFYWSSQHQSGGWRDGGSAALGSSLAG